MFVNIDECYRKILEIQRCYFDVERRMKNEGNYR